MDIIGGGFAGLIAAHYFPTARVYEAGKPLCNHRAVLRFRTEKVSQITGIPFKRVTVRKGIYTDGRFVEPNIAIANMYAAKVLGDKIVGERSIFNTEPSTRFIAPADFYERLVDNLGDRIQFETPHSFKSSGQPIISTAPMPLTLKACGVNSDVNFSATRIVTFRTKLVGVKDVYQTIYYPDPSMSVYRATIEDDTLIIESVGDNLRPSEIRKVMDSFSLGAFGVEFEKHEQGRGKIIDIDRSEARAIIRELSDAHNVYSLGRFATWRNVLLDDVADDLPVIEQLISMDNYQRKLKEIKS